MSCEGIWRVEVKGPYGWERAGTAFMRDGKYLGASANHYSVGTYTENGDEFVFDIVTTQHGNLDHIVRNRAIDKMQLTSSCKIKENEIIGTIRAEGTDDFDALICLTRLDSFD